MNLVFALTFLLAQLSLVGPGTQTSPHVITLTKRVGNGAYGNAAYSFRADSNDVKVHKNCVDILFSNCGLLHITPYGGTKSRIIDLGESTLEDAPDQPPADMEWNRKSIEAKPGHVYLEEMIDGTDSSRGLIKFRVDAIKGNELTISWRAMSSLKPIAKSRAQAGTMGACGGRHAAE